MSTLICVKKDIFHEYINHSHKFQIIVQKFSIFEIHHIVEYLEQYFQYNEFRNFYAFVQIFLEIMSFHNSFVRKLIAKIDPHVWRWKPHIHFNGKLTICANFNSAHYVALRFSGYEDIDSRANPLQEGEDDVIL